MMELNTYIGDIMDNIDDKENSMGDIVNNMETWTDWRHNIGVSTASEAAIVVGSIRKQLNLS